MALLEWHQFFDACLRKRVPPEKFQTLFKIFTLKHATLRGRTLVGALLDEGHKVSTLQVDPRIPLYVRQMLRMGEIGISEVLVAILSLPMDSNTNADHDQSQPTNTDTVESQRPRVETLILQMMTVELSNGLVKSKDDLQSIMKSMVKTNFNRANSGALGYFISAMLNSHLADEALNEESAKKLRSSFGHLLSTLVTQTSETDPQLANTLDYWQKQYVLNDVAPTEPLDLLNTVDLGALSFQESVLDSPAINTRAGLYVYLNALLYARPLFDDLMVIGFLNMRYKGDITNLVADLILASFDVLANAMYRNEPAESTTLLRSFLVNKLPVFLNNYAGMIFPPLSVQYCIEQALLRVDPAAFPSFTQMFDLLGKSSMLSEARQEFLFACALHQLIPEQSIELLLGDVPMQSLPASGKYDKDDLVVQCHASPGKIEELIGELENMEGNAGEIASALVEIIQTLCTNNDTMTLKNVLNILSRKPSSLDVILLFTHPSMLLQPLCHILDNWQDHEDQGEHQPVYDEFGSILLFVMIVRHRFELQDHELGIDRSSSFMRKYLRNACVSKSPEDLTEHEKKLLGGWIRGLFETEGISDELMSMCSPKEFHLLVASLFDQSLKACQAKVLALDTLKGGLEYLLESFLLPSLIAGLTWFTTTIWLTTEASTPVSILLPSLETLLKPPSISSDSSAMHAAVLSIVAKPLEDSLTHAQRQNPLRADINPLLETMKPYASKARHDAAAYTELEGWAATGGGGLGAALRAAVRGLVLWSSAGNDMSPPHYTHRQLVDTLHILGPKAVLRVLIDEVMAHFEAGTSDLDIVLDIVVVMIAAPRHDQFLPSPSAITEQPAAKHQLTLSDALNAENADAFEFSKTNISRASMIVRLHRRVEALVGRGSNVANVVVGDNEGMANAVVHNSEGLPTADIDDILVHAEQADQQMVATQDFLTNAAGSFIDVGDGMNLG